MAEYIIKNLTVLDSKTKKDVQNWIHNHLKAGEEKPFLIRTNFDTFFKCLLNNIEASTPRIIGEFSKFTEKEKEAHKEKVRFNIEVTKKKLISNFNFIGNSSIWIRLCDNGDWDGSSDDTKTDDVKNAIEEFQWFRNLDLYKIKPAQEYIEYQLRAQSQNYLTEIGSHGVYITPMIYSDEVKFRQYFLENGGSKIGSDFLDNKDTDGFKSQDVALRILLVDDKISGGKSDFCGTNIGFSTCKDCKQCLQVEEDDCKLDYCKLKIIRKLLSGEFILNDTKKGAFRKKTLWADSVESVVIDELRISDIWDVKTGILELNPKKIDELNKQLNPQSKVNKDITQIVGARDLETALTLMSCCKFDIILLDYLLGTRDEKDTERAYSTELFEFLSYDFNEAKTESNECGEIPAIVEMLKKNYPGYGNKLLKEFQDNVKLNRGPLDRYWIIPMTSYNSSFISDLQRKHVRLIDHRWNISQGADPINTPWKFLHKINEFVDLQLRSCVFHMEQLLYFLKYTCEDCRDLYKEKEYMDFPVFQSFMGSEYASFMRRYGNRHLIQRDAIIDTGGKEEQKNSTNNKSLFATYIWKNFYGDSEYYDVIELNRLAHKFYHQASTMYNDRAGRQRLNEAFANLNFFVQTNNKVKGVIRKNGELEELLSDDSDKKSLGFLRKVIAECTKK